MRAELPARWRITEDGHLERSLAGGTWSRALPEQPVAFRVVSVTANDVWVGGSKGSLFHSRDGGMTWQQVPIRSRDSAEQGNVVAIEFDTPQHGTVSTDGGAKWTTSDGGQTWTRR
jgi:photosystem II stability/assembly factor-like uncharacterized protein